MIVKEGVNFYSKNIFYPVLELKEILKLSNEKEMDILLNVIASNLNNEQLIKLKEKIEWKIK